MTVPAQPKRYHIAHVNRLPSIVVDGHLLWCDREVLLRAMPGTMTGVHTIKQRPLNELQLSSLPALFVREPCADPAQDHCPRHSPEQR
ncbi:MAG: hypothetical protein JWQ90_5061 [Hydrocarboniphaga sp.]|uniref:DarT ssDNA thymidine ADP-ribosyltransferase family protein n=1 Tax=Hydrocarboniphaga sp. TaxID=2033016 RepID=UPI00280CC15C|nr:hypothetical protein [Hydrocarboniphaga sp.]